MAASSSGASPTPAPVSLPADHPRSPTAVPKSRYALAVAADLITEFDALELELAEKIGNAEIRMEDALRIKRRTILGGTGSGFGLGRGFGAGAMFRNSGKEGILADEVRVSRATEGLMEAYRRLSRPEKVGRSWSTARWTSVAKVFAKLRSVAGVSAWELPLPACNASRDPQCLAETGIDDHSKAGDSIDETEGEVDARIIRVASRLVMERHNPSKEKDRKFSLTHESRTLSRLVLINLRNTGSAIERLLGDDQADARESVLAEIRDAYGALAANLACLRQRFADEMKTTLEAKQDVLQSAATAACNLGLARPGSPLVQATRHGVRSPSRPSTSSKAAVSQIKKAQGDPFMPLHQATLLMNISSLAQVSTPRSTDSDDAAREKNWIAMLMGSDKAGQQNDMDSSNVDEDQGPEEADWNIEFTASQLRLMKKAVDEGQPEVRGGQQLLRDTLECYEKCAEAMSCAYSDEKALRANPAEINQHHELLTLVRELQSLWRDAGAVLVPSRQADLKALESVRRRHERIVLRAFRAGGLQVASVVLARLALVDEMAEEPGNRQLTGELPWELIKPYQLVEAIVHHVGDGNAANDERRRRRWLRCPHASVHSVLAGEVWRQLLLRFLTVEAAFEPLLPCTDSRLSFREFRIALCLLEISLSERLAAMLFEAAEDASGEDGTLKGLLDVIQRYGPTSSGDRGLAAEAATAAARALAKGAYKGGLPMEAEKETSQRSTSKRVSAKPDFPEAKTSRRFSSNQRASLNNPVRASILAAPGPGAEAGTIGTAAAVAAAPAKKSAALLLQGMPHGAPMVCSRCLRGDLPVLPHTSVQELNRQTAISRGSGNIGRKAATRRRSSLLLGGKTEQVSLARSGSVSDSDDEVGEEMEEKWQAFGEDAIVSWATSVLAQGVLLCKDERGTYFKWLARIVLYGVHVHEEGASVATKSGASSATGKKMASIDQDITREAAREANRRRSLLQSGGSERKFSITSEAGKPGPEGAISFAGAKRGSTLDQAFRKRSVMAVGDEESVSHLARLREDSLAREVREEWEEAIREVSLALPDSILNGFRIDLGLQQLCNVDRGDDFPRASLLQPVQGLRSSLLFSDFTDAIAKGGGSYAHRAKRAAREVKILVGLRHLNVAESELQYLQRELALVAESHAPQVNGLILVAGAARAAQTILVHRQPTKAKPKLTQSGSAGQSMEPRNPNKKTSAPSKSAQDVISSSSKHTARCYERSGFEPHSHRVAQALRFLEYELFSSEASLGSSGASGEGTAEKVTDIAPLLLPAASSDKLLEQARREAEEEEETARRTSKEATSPSDKKGAPPLELKTIVRVKSIGSHRDSSASSSRASTPRDFRPASPLSQATGSSGSRSRPRSRSSSLHRRRQSSQSVGSAGKRSTDSSARGRGRLGSSREVKKRASSPLAQAMDMEVESRPQAPNAGAYPFPVVGAPPGIAPVGDAPPEDLNGQLSREDLVDWPPSVQQLFHSVSAGRSWIRRTVRPGLRSPKRGRHASAQFAAAQMLRSNSAPNMLPYMHSDTRSGYSSISRANAKTWQKGKVVSEVVQVGRPHARAR